MGDRLRWIAEELGWVEKSMAQIVQGILVDLEKSAFIRPIGATTSRTAHPTKTDKIDLTPCQASSEQRRSR